MVTSEKLDVQIDIDVGDGSLDSLIGKLETVEHKVNDLDGEKLTLEAELEGEEAVLAKAEALEKANGDLEDGVNSTTGSGREMYEPRRVYDGFDLPDNSGNLLSSIGIGDGDDGDRDRRNLVTKLSDKIGDKVGHSLSDVLDSKTLSGMLPLDMSKFYTLIANLVPVLLVFVGAVPAAVTALLGLAAAAGAAAIGIAAIAGLGALGLAMEKSGGGMPTGKAMQEIVTQVKEDLFNAVAPIAQRLSSLARDGLQGLTPLLEDLSSTFMQANVFPVLKESARDFGGFLQSYLPDVVESIGRLTGAFKDNFGEIGQFILRNDIIGGLIRETNRMIPAMRELGGMFVTAIPTIVQVSEGFLVAAIALLKLVGVVWSLISLIPLSNKHLGILIAGFLTLASVLGISAWMVRLVGWELTKTLAVGLRNAVVGLGQYIAAQWGANTSLGAFISLLSVLTGGALLIGTIASLDTMSSKLNSIASAGYAAQGAMKSLSKTDLGGSGMGLGSPTGSSGGGGDLNYYSKTNNYSIRADSAEAAKRAGRNVTYREKNGKDSRLNSESE